MKTVFVVPSAVFGGAHNQIIEMASELAGTDISYEVYLPREIGDAAARLSELGIPVRIMSLRRIRSLRYIRKNLIYLFTVPLQTLRLAILFRRNRIEVVQVHGITQIDVAVAARVAKAGLVWQLLDTRAPDVLCRILRPFLLLLPSAIMVTGARTADLHLGGRSPRATLIEYLPPVRRDLVKVRPGPLKDSAKADLLVGPSDVAVVSIGNLNPQKGFENLLRGFALANLRVAKLRIRGGRSPQHPDYLEFLQDLASELDLDDSTVAVLNNAEQVPRVLAAADIFCLSSEPRSEGIPTVLLEAMSCEVPVLAANVGSTTEVIRDGIDGLVHESRDIDTLKRQLTNLVEDEGMRSRLASAGKSRFDDLTRGSNFAAATSRALSIAYADSRR